MTVIEPGSRWRQIKGPDPSRYGRVITISHVIELPWYTNSRGEPIPQHHIEEHPGHYIWAEHLFNMYTELAVVREDGTLKGVGMPPHQWPWPDDV